MRNSNLNSVSTKNQHEVSIKKERSAAAVMILDNSSCDQGRFPVKLDFFLKKNLKLKVGSKQKNWQRIDLWSETKVR